MSTQDNYQIVVVLIPHLVVFSSQPCKRHGTFVAVPLCHGLRMKFSVF